MGSKLFKDFIKKAILERQPGPPPREGLRWKPQTHRWIRPKEQVSQLGTGGKYSPELAEQQRPALQQIMNERLASADTKLGMYEIGQNMTTSDKILNEVMLDEMGKFGGKSVFDEMGINTENLSAEEEQHLYDFMDSITESAMEHHGIQNETAEDYDEDYENGDDEDDDEIDTDPEGLSTHGHQNFLREEAERKKAGIVRPYDSDVVTYTDFVNDAVNEGLVERLPDLLNDFKSGWEAQNPSVRSKWGSPEWQDEVNEITFEAGFAMPEGGENENEDLDKASEWIATKIRSVGVDWHGFGFAREAKKPYKVPKNFG